MTQSFNDAQQAANVAYDMTLAETSDISQAADSYKSVMAAYMAQAYPPRPRQYIASARDVTPVKTMADRMCATMHAETIETQRMIEAAWPTLPEIEY